MQVMLGDSRSSWAFRSACTLPPLVGVAASIPALIPILARLVLNLPQPAPPRIEVLMSTPFLACGASC